MKDYLGLHEIEAKEADYLYTGTSQIPDSGQGLYTAIPIYKDEIISLFAGESISSKEAAIRANNGEDTFFINMPDGSILDSMHVNCFAKYANDPMGIVKSAFKSNSKISLDEHQRVCIVAKRKIKEGEEIFCGYGKRYWENYRKKYE
ncbi:MAG: SET domain-containing protein-lysine N-methyltransferase [Bacteroidota bacterium]|nr:SET domain-containing protein-lysine N-methyltransferase [Bacteroidota bacterium]